MNISGIVYKGQGRGNRLGFPTANLPAVEGIADGLYLARTKWEENLFPSLVFVGSAETFRQSERTTEVYLLDFSNDLYGQRLEVELVKKIRENKKFSSAEELVEQMEEDERLAREYFGI